MKFIKKNEKFSIPFEDVGCGEIFESGSVYYMKVYDVLQEKYYGACIVDGEICDTSEFPDMCRVVNAELHILD